LPNLATLVYSAPPDPQLDLGHFAAGRVERVENRTVDVRGGTEKYELIRNREGREKKK